MQKNYFVTHFYYTAFCYLCTFVGSSPTRSLADKQTKESASRLSKVALVPKLIETFNRKRSFLPLWPDYTKSKPRVVSTTSQSFVPLFQGQWSI